MINAPPMLNKRALLALGWTSAWISLILSRPDRVEKHTKGYHSWEEHLYTRDRVDEGMRDPRFVEAIAKRAKRKLASVRRQESIPTQYPSWRDALPDACAGLFSLNRYAKHGTCSPLHKAEIYRLKNELIEVLYRDGCCSASWIHKLEQQEQLCRECDGGDFCNHCDGSGVWKPARTLEFWCFRFEVEKKTYCWHQPKASVQFQPIESVPPQEWEGLAGEKPIILPRRKFALAKELLRWVIDRAATEGEEDTTAATSQSQDVIPF